MQVSSAATDLLELTEENVEKVLDEVSSVVLRTYSGFLMPISATKAVNAIALLAEAGPAYLNPACNPRYCFAAVARSGL